MQKIHKAKKSLGQNFLKSVPALNKIVEAGEISKDDIILEIGPGKGALTEKLLEKSNCVVAVEKDRDLYELLKNKFSSQIQSGSLVLVHEDILEFSIQKMAYKFFSGPRIPGAPIPGQTSSKNFSPSFEGFKIIANIPYNITGAILKKFLTEKNQPSLMVLMVQNEVAKRIVARDGKESILSISVKAYGEPKMVMKVPARYFSPAPKVDSAVIAIKNISRKVFIENKVDEEVFWQIIHAGFAHKRKILHSNLKKYDPLLVSPLAGGEKTTLIKTLGTKRAEELTLKDWIKLIKMIQY